MKKNDFDYLVSILEKNAGWHFTEDDFFVLDKKISNFVREKGYAAVEELIDELRLEQKPFINQLVEAMTMLETSFFRNYNVFKQLEESILPYLREYNRGIKKLRIWSAGCSTGQETYSLAIAIKRSLLNVRDWSIDILGTDLSSVAIHKAQKGIYNKFEIQNGMNASSIIANFHPEKENWQINDDIMSMVQFRQYNLQEDIVGQENFDIIFCRNVLHLFSAENQTKILEKLLNKQTFGGLLYIGQNEKLSGIEQFYTKVPGFDCLYQAKNQTDNKPAILQHDKTNQLETEKSSAMPSFIKPKKLFERPTISSLLKR
ncbi:MAG: protein-glutamate O-methyltransferase CheR [Alphaproteobacteria bacterium]|nr:protein-glutamate O-methyltransferase CheR [Alphaproteobacteria bacterium]